MIPLSGAIELGLIYGLVALGVYLTFRIINFPDLTVDGTFPLGAAIVALLLTKGMHPFLATFFAMGGGFIAGAVTGFLNVSFRIMGLLAGILSMTALYSINIRIMGRPNIALLDINTLFSTRFSPIWLLFAIAFVCFFGLLRFLRSQYGLALRASGMNPRMSRAYGVDVGKTTILALALSNSLVALAGALFAQVQGFADVSLGTGTIISGLAAVIIGEAIFGTNKIHWGLCGCIFGAILYRFIIALALSNSLFGFQASDLNLVTSALIILILAIPRLRYFIFKGRSL